jgi:hypothetical protein
VYLLLYAHWFCLVVKIIPLPAKRLSKFAQIDTSLAAAFV